MPPTIAPPTTGFGATGSDVTSQGRGRGRTLPAWMAKG
jgi:hypothetical protein